MVISRVVHPGDTYTALSEGLEIRPCVASLCLGNCRQDLFSGCPGVCPRDVSSKCPRTVLEVSWSLSSSWPWHILRMHSWGVAGCVLGVPGSVAFGYFGVCSQVVTGLAPRLLCAFPS